MDNRRGITTLALKLYHRAIARKTIWHWPKNRHIDQLISIKDPDINSHTYGHLIFDKESKIIQWKKENIFNKCCWHNWYKHYKRIQIDPHLSSCMILKSKRINDLNINPVTLNPIEEKMRITLKTLTQETTSWIDHH